MRTEGPTGPEDDEVETDWEADAVDWDERRDWLSACVDAREQLALLPEEFAFEGFEPVGRNRGRDGDSARPKKEAIRAFIKAFVRERTRDSLVEVPEDLERDVAKFLDEFGYGCVSRSPWYVASEWAGHVGEIITAWARAGKAKYTFFQSSRHHEKNDPEDKRSLMTPESDDDDDDDWHPPESDGDDEQDDDEQYDPNWLYAEDQWDDSEDEEEERWENSYHSARYDVAALSSDVDWTPTSVVCANKAVMHALFRTTLDDRKRNGGMDYMTDRSLTVLGGVLERWLDFLVEENPTLQRRKYLFLLRKALLTDTTTARFDVPPFWNSVCALTEPIFSQLMTYL